MEYQVSEKIQSRLSALTENASVQKALAFMKEDQDKVIEKQIELTLIPAPTYHEEKKAARLLEMFKEEGLTDCHIDEYGNCVGIRKGTGGGKTTLVEGHMDTVFPLDTELKIVREDGYIKCPGIVDDKAVAGKPFRAALVHPGGKIGRFGPVCLSFGRLARVTVDEIHPPVKEPAVFGAGRGKKQLRAVRGLRIQLCAGRIYVKHLCFACEKMYVEVDDIMRSHICLPVPLAHGGRTVVRKAFKLPAALSLAAEKQPEKLRDRRIIFIRAALVKRERLERVVVRIIARQEHRTVYEQLGKHMVIAQQILQDRLQLFNILKLLRGKIGRRFRSAFGRGIRDGRSVRRRIRGVGRRRAGRRRNNARLRPAFRVLPALGSGDDEEIYR